MNFPIIDCDADPVARKHLSVVFHQKHGSISLNLEQICLLPLTDESVIRETIQETKQPPPVEVWLWGSSLLNNLFSRARAMGGIPLNACALDYLLQHEDCIPLDWEGKKLIFANTRYKGQCHGCFFVHAARVLRISVFRSWRKDFESGTVRWKFFCLVMLPFLVLASFRELGHGFVEEMFDFSAFTQPRKGYYMPVYIP